MVMKKRGVSRPKTYICTKLVIRLRYFNLEHVLVHDPIYYKIKTHIKDNWIMYQFFLRLTFKKHQPARV